MFGKSGEETISNSCRAIIEFSTFVHNFYKKNLPMKNLRSKKKIMKVLKRVIFVGNNLHRVMVQGKFAITTI